LEKIILNTPTTKSDILIGKGWESVSSFLPAHGVVIITDENLKRLYGKKFPEVEVLTIKPGEKSKELDVIENLANKLLELGIDRTGFVLAIGGGVVCDIAGFLASVYMRGIRCGYVASSLLAQVDASTGGKNGIDLGGTKNILGTIRQPEFVICDPSMLITLPEDEYLSGLVELIKTAVIGDNELFDIVENNYSKVMERDNDLLTILVSRSVNFKAHVVSVDEREIGLRRILNFGHTYGHAVEMYNDLKHGFAVAMGMELATEFSYEKGYINVDEKERIVNLLKMFNLLQTHNIPDDQVQKLVSRDKKKEGGDINFVFTEGIGKAVVQKIKIAEIIDFYKRFSKKNK
jgi:3-dehydroquinate synthase